MMPSISRLAVGAAGGVISVVLALFLLEIGGSWLVIAAVIVMWVVVTALVARSVFLRRARRAR